MLEFFATKAPDPPHGTLNSCFGVFRTIWVHLVPFGYLTKLGVKWAEVVQKFVPWSRFRIFRNERIWSTPKDSILMFWRVLCYLGSFGTVWLHSNTWCKTGWSGAKVRAMKSCRNFSQQTTRSTPLDPCFVAFQTIWVHLGQFVALQHSVQNGLNWCKSSCHEVASEFFVANAPDPPHCTLNSCFGVFCTIWMHLDHLVAVQNSMQNGLNWCKSSCHRVAS